MRTLLVCLLILIAATAFAQSERTQLINAALNDATVSEEDYIIGIGTADKNHPMPETLARERAVKEVFDKLTSRFRNIILANKNRAGGGHQQVAAYYSSVAQAPRVAVQLPHIEDIPIPSGVHNIYALVVVNRKELIDFYARETERLRGEIDRTLNDPSLAGNPTYATKQYLGTYARYEALKEAEMIMLGAAVDRKPDEIFQTLHQYATQQHDAIYNVDRYFETQYPVTDAQSVARVISTQLQLQNPHSTDRVQLDPFTYDISETVSRFSITLAGVLERELTVKWATFPPPAPAIPNVHPLGFGRNITSRLSGTFWTLGNKVTVRATLRDVNTGEFQAAAVVRFNKNLRNINVNAYVPPDYQFVVDTLVADAESRLENDFEIVTADFTIPAPETTPAHTVNLDTYTAPSPRAKGVSAPDPVYRDTAPRATGISAHQPVYRDSGFTVELRTDRPERANFFYIGERTSVWVRVNRPAYYRLGYGFADGRYAILRDNEYIDGTQVNQWVKVPGTLVFTEPAGAEYLRVIAQETELLPIQTYIQGKNHFLSTPESDTALRGGLEQARANIAGLRGGYMEAEVDRPEASTSRLRGAFLQDEDTEAKLTIVTVEH